MKAAADCIARGRRATASPSRWPVDAQRLAASLLCLLALTALDPALAQGAATREDDQRGTATRDESEWRESARDEAAREPAATDARAWWERMLAAEGRYRFEAAPDERSTLPGGPRDEATFTWPAGASLERIERAFELEVVERTRIGERTAVVLRATPRHDGVTWVFWVDVETGARLAYQATVASGRVVAEGRAEGPPLRSAEPRPALPEPREPPPDIAERWRAVFGGLPGFDPVDVVRIALEPGVPALRVTLWDGLSGVVLVVFQAPARLPERDFVAVQRVGELTLALVGPLEPYLAASYLEWLAASQWAAGGWDALMAAMGAR